MSLDSLSFPTFHNSLFSCSFPSSTPFDPILQLTTSALQSDILCSPLFFARALRRKPLASYLCVLRTSAVTSDSLSSHSESFQRHFTTHFPSVFPDELPAEPPPPRRLQHTIDLVPNYTIPPRRLYRQTPTDLLKPNVKLKNTFKLGIFVPPLAHLVLLSFLLRKKMVLCVCVLTTVVLMISLRKITFLFLASMILLRAQALHQGGLAQTVLGVWYRAPTHAFGTICSSHKNNNELVT